MGHVATKWGRGDGILCDKVLLDTETIVPATTFARWDWKSLLLREV